MFNRLNHFFVSVFGYGNDACIVSRLRFQAFFYVTVTFTDAGFVTVAVFRHLEN